MPDPGEPTTCDCLTPTTNPPQTDTQPIPGPAGTPAEDHPATDATGGDPLDFELPTVERLRTALANAEHERDQANDAADTLWRIANGIEQMYLNAIRERDQALVEADHARTGRDLAMEALSATGLAKREAEHQLDQIRMTLTDQARHYLDTSQTATRHAAPVPRIARVSGDPGEPTTNQA